MTGAVLYSPTFTKPSICKSLQVSIDITESLDTVQYLGMNFNIVTQLAICSTAAKVQRSSEVIVNHI